MQNEKHTSWAAVTLLPRSGSRSDTATTTSTKLRSHRLSKAWRALAGAMLACVVLSACSAVPVTGRRQFNVLSIDQDIALGAQAYEQQLDQSKIITSGPQYEQVKRVVDRLVQVADDPGFDWEVNVIDDPQTVNAWAMPGGKMAVYTGILPVTQDDTGLAVVMGHEIGHAVARHGTERVTQNVGISLILEFISGQHREMAGQIANFAVGLPWGRKQELESDRIGLIYMARAGYDPREAADFWRRMAELSQGAPPEFLSTHPANETRIEQIEKYLPEAVEIYFQNSKGADSR